MAEILHIVVLMSIISQNKTAILLLHTLYSLKMLNIATIELSDPTLMIHR